MYIAHAFGRVWPHGYVLFIDDYISIENDWEMCLNGRNWALMLVGVDESSKSLMFDHSQDIEESK